MSGFLPEESVRNKAADEPWKRSETDRMLDLYFSGHPPDRIAQTLGRNPKAVKRRLEQFRCNEREWANRYEPRQRLSRKGKRLTENESLIIQAHIERDVPRKATAALLARPLDEITGGAKMETAKVKNQLRPLPIASVDLIWAYRYAFHVYKERVISDKAYDTLVQEEIEFGGGGKAFLDIKGSDSCPARIKSLAMYLVEASKGK